MWFTETPWPPIIICVTAAVVLGAAWVQSRRTKYLAIAVGLVAVCPVLFAIERIIETDSERLEVNVHEIVTAFKNDQLNRTLDFISPDAAEIRAQVKSGIELVDVQDDLAISDVTVKLLAEGSRATTHFRVNATINITRSSFGGYQPTRWELTWERRADAWQVIKVRQLDPIRGDELGQWQ